MKENIIKCDESIINQFAQLLNFIYRNVNVEKYTTRSEYHNLLSQKLKISSKFNHTIIESQRYLLEDTDYAIFDFIEFGISGHTKHYNIGELYIRLYGFLNAIYLQCGVPISLMEIFEFPNIKDAKDKLYKTKLIRFRAIAGAHTLNHGDKNHTRLTQTTLTHKMISYLINDKHHEIDLKLELFEFYKVYFLIMSNIFNLIIKKLFQEGSEEFKKSQYCLYLIQQKIKGAIIFYNELDGYNVHPVFIDDEQLLMKSYFLSL